MACVAVVFTNLSGVSMDTRYLDRGYKADFHEMPYGAFLTIRDRKGEVVKEVAFGFFRNVKSGPELLVRTVAGDKSREVYL